MTDDTRVEPRPFDPAEIASSVAAGQTVHLGRYLLMCLDGTDYAAGCSRCIASHRIPFTSLAMASRMEEFVAFIMRHVHQEPRS